MEYQNDRQVTHQAMAAIQGHLSRYSVTETGFVTVKIGREHDEDQQNGTREEEATNVTNPLNQSATSGKKEFYLLLHDVSKKVNVGTLLRSASAFGCSGIIVRAKKRSEVPTFGAHGADNHLPFHFVEKEMDIFSYAKSRLGCFVVGIEIKPEAVSVCEDGFADIVAKHDRIAFVLGNEGIGMHAIVAANCDAFVYIPHYGAGTASLNVAIAGSIIFHRFGSLAGFQERERKGEKFIVETLDVEKRRALDGEGAVERRQRREAKRASAAIQFGTEELSNHTGEDREEGIADDLS